MILDGKQERENELQHLIDVIDGIVLADVINLKAGFKPGQARDKDGQWSKTGGSWHSVDLKEQMDAHNEFGGSSFGLNGENLIGKKNSFSVGVFEDKSLALPKGTVLTQDILNNYYEKYKDILKTSDDLIIGSWVDEEKIHWVDITKIVKGLKEAKELKKLGIAHNQKAIFDLENVVEIDTYGTGK